MNVYEIRAKGKGYCETEGSEHYKADGGVEALDLIIACGYGEGFAAGSIIKYAARFNKTQNLNDLKKISDYSHILCGVKLGEKLGEKKPQVKRLKCLNGYCSYFNHIQAIEKCLEMGPKEATGGCSFRESEEMGAAK